MCTQTLQIPIKDPESKAYGLMLPVPCGKCPECAKAKLSAWLFRFEKQLEISTNPLFVTLTYNDKNLPWVTVKGQTYRTLSKRHVQLFFKRLRKKLTAVYAKLGQPPKPFKYYLVGEYGSRYRRPHYHAIIMDMDYPELILDAWQYGFVYTPPLKDGGIKYVLKYLSKPKTKLPKGVQKEYSQVSKGIGANYLTNGIRDWHWNNIDKPYITKKGGIKMSIPKYYKEKLFDDSNRLDVTAILEQRAEIAKKEMIDNLKRTYPDADLNKILQILEIRKKNVKFAKRNEKIDVL